MLWRHRPLGLILALAFLSVHCDTRRTDSLRALAEGMERYRTGSYTDALRRFREAVKIDEQNDKAHYYLALLASHQFQDYKVGERHFRKAMDLNSADPEYHYQLGALLQHTGRGREAMGFLEHVVAVRPGHYNAHYRLGESQRQLGAHPMAVAAYTRAIELNPRFARPFIALGNIYLLHQHPKEAEQVFRNCSENLPDEPECHNELGRAKVLLGDTDGAIAAFTEALERRPDYSGALFSLGHVYKEVGNTRKAIFYLKRYLSHADRKLESDRVAGTEMVLQRLSSGP